MNKLVKVVEIITLSFSLVNVVYLNPKGEKEVIERVPWNLVIQHVGLMGFKGLVSGESQKEGFLFYLLENELEEIIKKKIEG